jgi:hypothetical protein
MLAQQDHLAKASRELKQALSEVSSRQAESWKRSVDHALAHLAPAIEERLSTLEDTEGRAVDVDTPLNPSPTVARRTLEFRQELTDLLREAQRLRGKLGSVQPTPETDTPANRAGALAVEPEVAEVTDFDVFCERLEQLVHRLGEYDEEEAKVIQQSVNLDLGAGD